MSMFKRYRLSKEMSQEEMANKLGISTLGYRNYELGLRMMPADVLLRFLRLRGEPKDLELADILEEVCEVKKQ